MIGCGVFSGLLPWRHVLMSCLASVCWLTLGVVLRPGVELADSSE